MTETILLAVWIGVAATVTMDVLASASRKLGLATGVNGRWVGRWYLGIARGQLLHANIAATQEHVGELLAALVGHYAIGVTLAVLYVVGAQWLSVSPSALPVALGYGFSTCVFPWFLLFPSMGFGLFGLKGPPELRMLRASVINHLSYGFGLWWMAALLPLG